MFYEWLEIIQSFGFTFMHFFYQVTTQQRKIVSNKSF